MAHIQPLLELKIRPRFSYVSFSLSMDCYNMFSIAQGDQGYKSLLLVQIFDACRTSAIRVSAQKEMIYLQQKKCLYLLQLSRAEIRFAEIRQASKFGSVCLYYKHIKIVNDAYRVIRMMPQLGASLKTVIDDIS